jgi:hypothetical protein
MNEDYEVIDMAEDVEEEKGFFERMADIKISLPWVIGGTVLAVGACIGTGFVAHSMGYKKAKQEFTPTATAAADEDSDKGEATA